MPSNQENDEEISLLDLFAVLLHYKKLIIIMTAIFMFFSVAISVISLVQKPENSILPNKYTPKALMLIDDSSSKSGMASMLASSGMGALAGISSGSTSSALAVYFTNTNSFLDPIIEKFNLIERYEIEKFPKANSRKALSKVLKSDFDSDSGVFSISFTDIDPEFARSVVNYAVSLMEEMFLNLGIDKNLLEKKNLEDNILNCYDEILKLQKEIQKLEQSVTYGGNVPAIMNDLTMLKLEFEAKQKLYTQLKTQYELLKIQMASEKPIFQVIEKAEVPDMKSGPSRGKLCIIMTFAGGFLSVFVAFLLNAIKNIKNDPEAIKKLRKRED